MDARFVVFISLVASAIAGPLSTYDSDNNKCATKCTESNNYKYSPRTTYIYDYKVDTDSSLAGAFQDSAKTTLQTSVNIEVLSPCEFSLQLRNTKMFHTDGKGAMKTADRENEFGTEVETYPLRFSFQNGVVDHVCSDNDESVRSLNFKKGILSAFQNGMGDITQSQNVTETDVVGTCKAEYKVVSNGYYTTEVKKVKDILSCTDRLDFKTILQSTFYKVPSDLQNLPIRKTTHECDQAIEKGGVLKSSTCKESHVYRPFANGESGARTIITQTLTYQTYRSGISLRTLNTQSRSSLHFDHSADHLTQEQSRMAVEKKLAEVCDSTRYAVRPETPRLFTDLVAAMKGLDKVDLTELHRLLKTKTMCPTNGKAYKFFHDALPMLNTKASVSLMTELINTKDVTGMEATAWLTSLAFIQSPTSDMLLDVKALLDNKDVRAAAMLPVSSMVNNFCKMGTCNQDSSVLSLMSSIERNIDNNCDSSGNRFELTLLTLKAIGNAGHAIKAIPVLNKCMTSKSNPLEIRVTAAEAFRRMPCAAEDKSLWETLTNKDLDSELRINAYLALMRCPTQENLGKVADILSDEEDEQVGAFVYSHLTNLRETSDPHKQTVADSINKLSLEKEFDLNPLKFSRNFEVSALLNKINTGIAAEGNMIWSNKVQLPRAVSGNLTVHLFGQSVNLLDFGGRLEGLEYLIKNIFGTYMNSDDKPKIDAENVKGSFYGRLFGNEMIFMHSQTAKSLFGGKTPNYLDILINMANKQHVALAQSVQFMDICMVIPSTAGLPIYINVNGTATVDLSMTGKMDLRKIGASPRSMDIDGEIRPSAALEITGSMYVDSFVTKTGLRMRNTLYTSTAMKGRIQMNRGQQLNVELDTPEDKMEIFDARSKFVLLHDDTEQEQKMVKENRKEYKLCSSKQMAHITGMEVCGELSFPNASMKADSPYFPFTGPTSVSVTVFKKDSHSGYKIFAKKIENKKVSMTQVSFNTPGSQVNRAISVDLTLNYKKQHIEMNMASPWKKLAVNGNLINVKDLNSVRGSVVFDDKDTYAMTGDVKVAQSKGKIQVNPMIELRRPGADNIEVTGFVAVEKPLKSVIMEMSLSGINKLPYTLKSALTNNKKEKSVQASISLDGKNEHSFKASNKMSIMGKKSMIAVIQNLLEVRSPERKLMSLTNNVDYREDKSLKIASNLYMYRVLKKPVALKVNLLKTARKKSTNYKGVMNVKTSHVSGSIVCSVNKRSSGSLSVTSKVDYTVPKVAKNTIHFSGKFIDRSTKAYNSYIMQSNIGTKKNPEYNSNMRIEVGHKRKLSYVSADVKYGANPKDKTKRVYLLTSLSRKVANTKSALVNYKVKAQAPAHNIDYLLQGKHEHSPKLLDSSVTLTYASKNEIIAGITLRNKGSKLAKINGQATISWPGQEYLINTDFTQKSAKQYSNVLNFKSSSGARHTISTVYKMSKSHAHDVVANLKMHRMTPVTISVSTNLNRMNFAASGEVKSGKDVYGFNTISKISKAPSARISLELIHPKRRITLDVNGGKDRGKYEGKVEAAWDADNDKNQKMSIEGGYFHKSAKGSISLGGNVNFRSPFAQFENLLGSVKYGMSKSQHAVNGQLMWGNKSDQIMSTITVKKPISLNNLNINGKVKTAFKGFRNAEIDIAHKFDSDLKTVIIGALDKETAKLSVQGQKLNNGYKGNISLKSTIKNVESVSLTASNIGSVGDGAVNSNVEFNHNNKVYAYDLTMSHSGDGWQRETSGDFVITMNKQKVATHWNHKNTDATVKSSLSTKWNKNHLMVDLIGSHKLSDLRNVNGLLKIKSPWHPARDVEFNIDHKHGTGLIDSVVFLRQGSTKKASSIINYKSEQNSHDFDLKIASPFHDDKSGKFSTNYESYPMTTSAELQWNPKIKGTMEGGLNLASWNNADFNVKITTTSRTIRNVVIKASNKKQKGEIVSNINLNYGMRQNIDIESRISNKDQNKMFRLQLSSPFKHVKSLNTGLNFNGNAYAFDTTADFELLPSIGKFDGSMNWQYEEEINGKIRLDTPFVNYPYFELSTSSTNDGDARKSHIQAEYHPRQVFSLDSYYHFGSPLSFDTTFRSPYPQFDGIGLSIQHNVADSSIKSHAKVKYQSDRKIEADLNADWTSDIAGDLVFKTPFSGDDSSKISIRYKGELYNFDSHGEINVAGQNIVADASFKNGYTTTGTFTFSSPIQGMESIDVSFRKKGNMKNLKSGATVIINGEKIQTAFNNKVMKDSLKTNFNFMTPRTDAFKISVDHSGLLDSFTNKFKVNYGRKVDIDTVASLSFRDHNAKGNAVLKYKLDKGRNTARVSFTKNGLIDDVSFTTTASINRDDISVSGILKTKNGFDGSLLVKTPFTNFKNCGLTLSHFARNAGFTSNVNINYMDKKNIIGQVEFSNENGMKLSSELTTPFKKLRFTSIKVSHERNSYSGEISGTAELTSTIGGLGTGDISYSKTGNLNDLVMKGSVSINGKDMAVLKLSNNIQNTEMHSICSIKSAAIPDIYFSIDHSGDNFNVNTKTMCKIGKNMVSTDANIKRSNDSISTDCSITYKLHDQRRNTASITLQKEGPLDNFNMDVTGKFNNDEMKLSAFRSGALKNMRFGGFASYNRKSINFTGSWKNAENTEGALKVLTPFDNFNEVGMTLAHSGDLLDFTTSFNGNYMDGKDIHSKVEFTANSLSNIKFASELMTPLENYETLYIKFNNKFNTYSSNLNGDATIDTNIAGFGTGRIIYSKTGDANNLDLRGSLLSNGKDLVVLKLTNKMQNAEIHSMCSMKSLATPEIYFSIDHSGDILSFKTKAISKIGKNMVSTDANIKRSYNSISADGSITYKLQGQRKNTASITFQNDGPSDNCNMDVSGKFNNDEVKFSASRSGALNDMRVAGSASYNMKAIAVTGGWKNTENIKGTFKVQTPFDNFNEVGMLFSHSGELSDFTSSFNINYMDGKDINGKLDLTAYPHGNIHFVSEFMTPFKDYKTLYLKFDKMHDTYFSNLNGNVTIDTNIAGFGTRRVMYSKTGDLNDLVVKGSVSSDGKDIAALKLINNMHNSELHSKCSLKTSATPEMYFRIDHSGDSFNFNTKTTGKIGKNIISADANMKRSYDSVSADGSFTVILPGQRKKTASIIIQKNGPMDNCYIDITGKFNNDEVKLSASRSGALNNICLGGSASYNKKTIDVAGSWKNTENIEGTLKVLTPFDNFKKVGMVISHSGDLSDFTSSFNINYMDGKDIHGKLELTTHSFSNIKFASELTTPFENLETLHIKLNNKYDADTTGLNGNAAFDTSIAGFGTGNVIYSKTGSMDNLEVTGKLIRNGVKVAELKIKNDRNDQKIHSSFECKGTATPHILLTLDHNGDLSNLKTLARAEIGKSNIITGEAYLNQRLETLDAEGKMMYYLQDVGSNQFSLSVHKERQLDNLDVELMGKDGAKISKIIWNIKNEDELTGDLTVNTPVEGYKNIGLSFKYFGTVDKLNCEGKLVLSDGEEFSGKINFYRHLFRRIGTVVKLNTPIKDFEFTKFEYRHEAEIDSLTCLSSLQYGNSQRVTYDMSATFSPKPEFTVTLKLPKKQFMASGSYENSWPRYAVKGKLDAGESRSISLDGSLDLSNDNIGVLTFSTPLEDFKNVGISFHHTVKSNGINTEGRITYMDGQVISGKAEATVSKKGSDASLQIITPFSGYELTSIETKYVTNKRIVKGITNLIYGNNKRITINAYSKIKPTPEFSFTVTSPFSSDIEAFISLDNTWPRYDLKCKMAPGNGDRFTLDGNFDATEDISGSLKIGTPFDNFNKIGMSLIHSGDSDQFRFEGTVNYMDGRDIFGKASFYRYMWRRVDASFELTTPFNGMENTKAEVNFEDNTNSISTTASLEYNNGNKLNGNIRVTYSPSYDAVITFNTPVNVIKVQGALDLTAPNYEALYIFNYGETVYSADGKLNFYSADHLDGSLEVNTPIPGFDFTKAEYQHKLDSSELEGLLALTYTDGKKMSCDIKSTFSPNFDGTLTVKTPFRGFEIMQGSSTFHSSYNKYETSSSLNLGQGRVFSMTSELDYSIEPIKASTKIRTPIQNFQNVEVDFTHEGDSTNFKTTGFLSSPLTNNINAIASLRYNAVMDMSAAASLQTSFEGLDDLKAELKNSDAAGEVKTNAVFGWTSGRQVAFDSTFRKQDGWNENKIHADVCISTPFVAVRSVNIQMDQSAERESYTQKINFDLNGDNLLDYDVKLNFNDKKTAELIVRQPWPMQYTASKTSYDGTTETEIFANWNRDEADNNVRIQSTFSDQTNSYQMENDVDISVTYASRKVGLVNSLSHKPSQILSNGHIYWDSDDDSKVSYDVNVNENHRRGKQIVDGSFKLGLPTRTLGLTGSYSENSAMASTDAAFSWDADRDDTKQFGVKTNVRRGDNLKGDITLSMPSLRRKSVLTAK